MIYINRLRRGCAEMAQSSASLALFTSRPSPPPGDEQPSGVLCAGSKESPQLCHLLPTPWLWAVLPARQSSLLPPHPPGHSSYACPSNPGTKSQGAHQSHNCHGWLRRVGEGMDHPASYPAEWEQEQGSPSPHSLTGHQVLLGPLPKGRWLRVKGHQWPHCHSDENDTVTPPPPHKCITKEPSPHPDKNHHAHLCQV